MPYKNKNAQRQYFKNYRVKNRERIKRRNAKHRADFPELYRAREKKRWATQKAKRAALRKAWGVKNAVKLRTYHREYSRRHYAAHLGHHREYQRKWYAKNRKKRIAARSKYVKENVLKVLAQARRYRKLPAPTRPTPVKCECCGMPRKKVVRNFALDHCHKKGHFRGWLCGRCNTGIGSLGDTLAGVMKAVRYLKKYGRKHRARV